MWKIIILTKTWDIRHIVLFPSIIQYKFKRSFYFDSLIVNCVLGGRFSSLVGEKCLKKPARAKYEYTQVLSKVSCTTFKTIFETLSALAPVIWPFRNQEIHDFRRFSRVPRLFFYFSSLNLFWWQDFIVVLQ